MSSGSANVATDISGASGASPVSGAYGSWMTLAPAAFRRTKSPFTSAVSMFQMIRPGLAVLLLTSLCWETVNPPVPTCHQVYPPSLPDGVPTVSYTHLTLPTN